MGDLTSRVAALPPEKRLLLAKWLQQEGAAGRPPLTRQSRESLVFPLSFAQERQWFLYSWDRESSLYTIAYGVRLVGVMDEAVLQRAVDEVVSRHEVLRTLFVLVDGRPCQVVQESGRVPIEQVDLCAFPAEVREQELQRLATAAAQRPFDLTRGPLFRLLLVRLGPDVYALVPTMHHMVFDGWSSGILIREIGALVGAFGAGLPSPLPPLAVQYADYAVWQRAWLQGQVLDEQLAYWRERLAGHVPVLQLPTDRPYPAIESAEGARVQWVLPGELADALVQLSRAQGATLFMVLLGVWKVLLYRYTSQEDVLVGTPVANRDSALVEPLIGYFANTLVLRTDLSGAPSFRVLLQRVRETTLAAYEHQDAPFEKVVEVLQPERHLGHSPLFQVMFVLQNDAIQTIATPSLTVAPFTVETGTAKFALTLEVTQVGEGLSLVLEYKTALFDGATIRRMLGHYEVLLGEAVRDPDCSIARMRLMSRDEERCLVRRWQGAEVSRVSGGCLHRLFEARVEEVPDRVAVTFEGQQVTYAEVNGRANQLGYVLCRLGVRPDMLVGLCVEPGLEKVLGVLGILKAGGAYVPVDLAYPRERIAFMVGDAQVSVLVTQRHVRERLPEVSAQVVCLDDEEVVQGLTRNLDVGVQPQHLAYVIYTSGSTGTPKGVMVEHGNGVRLFTATERWFHFAADDVWTLFHSHAFDFSVWELWGSLLYGGRVVVVPFVTARSPEVFYRLLDEQRVSVLNQTPSAFYQLVQLEESGAVVPRAGDLRLVIFGGEALNVRNVRPWFERHGDVRPQLVNMYGITETTVHVTYRPLRYVDVCEASGSVIGEPIGDLQLYVLDAYGQPVPLGVTGEVYVGGAGVARGYLNRPGLTAERFVPNPFEGLRGDGEGGGGEGSCAVVGSRLYRTGDLARVLPGQDIEYVGRADTQVKIRGFRIELGEIAAVLSSHAAVRDAVVVIREDVPGDKRLVAYVVIDAERPPSFGQLRSFAGGLLPDYMVPSTFIVLDAIPLTANGKVAYGALPMQQVGRRLVAEQATVVPTTPMEQLVAGLLAQILRLPQVGLHDNFFELGGHSLLATQVMTRVREAFGVEPSMRAFFTRPTVAGLVASIEAEQATAAVIPVPPLLALAHGESLPLSFAQQRLWFLNQLQPESAFYNVPLVLRLVGVVDHAVLEGCLSEVVRRHAVLRTTFVSGEGGVVVQRIGPPVPIVVPFFDVRAWGEGEREVEMQRRLDEVGRQPFDLTRDVLLRGVLVQYADDGFVLALTVHHIAFDEWSSGVLMQELAALYAAFLAGQPSPLPELAVQYADFTIWQRQWLQGGVLERQVGYWREQLGGGLPFLQMPTDCPRPGVLTFRGAHVLVVFEPQLYAAMQQFARQEEATLFMVLVAGWVALLHRYTGQDQVVVGTPIANRGRSELEGLIGYFANTLVLRARVAPTPTFRALLRHVREVALDAYAHQDVPFDQVVNAVQPERALSRTPLFQTMLVMQNVVSRPLVLPNLTISALPIENDTTKFELSLVLYDQVDRIQGWLEYSTDLFAKASMQRLLDQFVALLRYGVAHADELISHVPLASADEQELFAQWNADADDAYDLD